MGGASFIFLLECKTADQNENIARAVPKITKGTENMARKDMHAYYRQFSIKYISCTILKYAICIGKFLDVTSAFVKMNFPPNPRMINFR